MTQMLYTKIEAGQATNLAVELEYFVHQGLIAGIDATAQELDDAGIVSVTQLTERFPVDGYQYAIEIKQQSDGSWAQEMVQVEIPEAHYLNNVAVQVQTVKADRDRMLAATDWIVAKSLESAELVPETWKTYRQALRDLSTQPGFPFSIQWPELPNR